MSKLGANQYKQTQVMTASKGQILIMLYEAAIRHVKKASLSIDKNDMASKGVAVGKCHDIVIELMSSLDFKAGAEIAEQLDSLYHFIIRLLLEANIENSKDKLGSIQKILENLLEGWRGAIEQVEKNTRK